MTTERELRDGIRSLRGLVGASRDGFLDDKPYILTYSDIIIALDELEKLLAAAPAPTPAPPTTPAFKECMKALTCLYLEVHPSIGDDIQKRVLAAIDEARGWAFKCKAHRTMDPPQDCDWPTCGCDPHADKVIEALEESGKLVAPAEPVVPEREPQVGDEVWVRGKLVERASDGQLQVNVTRGEYPSQPVFYADVAAAPRAAGGQRAPRTVGCTADADCIHECPANEPEARLDEFKTTVIALCGDELTSDEKKSYIDIRNKELRAAAGPQVEEARAQAPKAIGDKILVHRGKECWLAQVISRLDDVAPAPPLASLRAPTFGWFHPGAPGDAFTKDEHYLRAYCVEGHWYVDIDKHLGHSGIANGATIDAAMDSAKEMLGHMRASLRAEGK